MVLIDPPLYYPKLFPLIFSVRLSSPSSELNMAFDDPELHSVNEGAIAALHEILLHHWLFPLSCAALLKLFDFHVFPHPAIASSRASMMSFMGAPPGF